jgi:hypothetical protein
MLEVWVPGPPWPSADLPGDVHDAPQTGTIALTATFSPDLTEQRMQDDQDRKGSTGGGTLALVAAFALVFAILIWGPWAQRHVESNPGPSGTPGSTAVEKPPPPADSPGETTGSAR